jgi:hypothetical protein
MQMSAPQRSARVSQLRSEAEQLRQVDARLVSLMAPDDGSRGDPSKATPVTGTASATASGVAGHVHG